MTQEWDILDSSTQPTMETIAAHVSSPLWDSLNKYMQNKYGANPKIEYSGCGMAPGWNVKYKKSRGLCTLYPDKGKYTALVVIGQKEKQQTEMLLPMLTEYTQALYANTKEGMGQRWLMMDVANEAILEDVKQLIAIRKG